MPIEQKEKPCPGGVHHCYQPGKLKCNCGERNNSHEVTKRTRKDWIVWGRPPKRIEEEESDI